MTARVTRERKEIGSSLQAAPRIFVAPGIADTLAGLDLGSNSFHMLVVREVAGALRTVTKVKRKVRLAAGLDPEFRLSRAAMERGWDCLRLFSEQLQDIPSDNIRVVGTATLRLATNVDEFLSEAERVLNHSIEIISGEEEAKTIYEGVSWTSAGEGNRLVIDIGGASTELVIGEQSEAKLLNSLHMGFRTLALEKRSAEVWEVLGAVKTEFANFAAVLAKTRKKLNEAANTIDDAEVRTRVMARAS